MEYTLKEDKMRDQYTCQCLCARSILPAHAVMINIPQINTLTIRSGSTDNRGQTWQGGKLSRQIGQTGQHSLHNIAGMEGETA